MELSWKEAPADLRDHVVGIVERVDGERHGPSVELPLANPLLHVGLGADYLIEQGGTLAPMPPVSLWGCASAPRRAAPQGRLHALVVVLTHRGAALAGDGQPLAGRLIDMTADRLAGAAELRERLLGAADFPRRAALIEIFFRGLVERSARGAAASPALTVADAIAAHRAGGSVSGLAERFGMTERTLRNRFARELGCSPKRLLRLSRLGRTVRALHPQPWGGRPAHDVRLEYFDEAHLHHEFRALTTLSPAEFARAKRASGDALVHSFVRGQ